MPKIDFITRRLANLGGTAEGSNLPPRQTGKFRVPFATNLKIVKTEAAPFGGTNFTLTWSSPSADTVLSNRVLHYNIYIQDLTKPGAAFAPFQVSQSPAVILIPLAEAVPLVFKIQTVLSSGMVSDFASCPTVVGVTVAPGVSITYPAATIPITALANGTTGELITWDINGIITTISVDTAGYILQSNGPGFEPSWVPQASLTGISWARNFLTMGG